MAYECRIYSPKGKLKKVYSEKMLAARSDAVLQFQTTRQAYSSTFLPREQECQQCRRTFWRTVRGKKYCSDKEPPYCSQKAFKRKAKIRAKGYREKRKQERSTA